MAGRCLLAVLVAVLLSVGARAADEADLFMGDWQGTLTGAEGEGAAPLVAQVIPLGGGTYRANLLPQFDARTVPLAVLEGTREGDTVVFRGYLKGANKPNGQLYKDHCLIHMDDLVGTLVD